MRTVTVAQARRGVVAAREHTIAMTPEERLTFWSARNEAPKLTDAQPILGPYLANRAGA